MASYSQVWDLDKVFKGGSTSSGLHKKLEELKEKLPLLKKRIQGMKLPGSINEWTKVLEELQIVGSYYSEISSYTSCLVSQNVKDEKAKILLGTITQMGADYEALYNALERKISGVSFEDWEKLRKSQYIKPILYTLEEMRLLALDKLSMEQEELASDLSVDGYHGWGEMYDTIVGKMQVFVEEDGEKNALSMGQLSNKLYHEDRDYRRQMFEKWEEAWKNEADLFATTLNHISGYRLQLYKHRKWNKVLKEPLDQNRMEEKTLQTMWDVIQEEKHRLIPYMDRKAKLMGLEKLSWVDVQAALPGSSKVVSYDDGANFIIDQFQKFSPDMAEFAKMAFENCWIEAEDRPGKRPGGFMTSFPVSQESRIFMTYSGTARCISTLAHELGHAYHSYVMRDLPLFSQQYAMNVAETASTFAELIVQDAAIKEASVKEEKIPLLADKIESSVSFFMDIHSRFLFEKKLYEKRKDGVLSTEQLCDLMVESQKEGFQDSLSTYNPYYWASKLHFYGTDVPFYNFPYSFGFLFSAGIYAEAREKGKSFSSKYINLLRDTARMKVEDLAERHLNVDLRKKSFWKKAVDVALEDIEEFLQLTE